MKKYEVEVTLEETYAIYEVKAFSPEEASQRFYAKDRELISGPHAWELDVPRIDNVTEVPE